MARMGVLEDWCPCPSGKALTHRSFYYRTYERLPCNNTGVSPIETVVYGIKWAHSMAGLEMCPVHHPLVESSLEGAKRKLARPVRPKEPLSVDTVQAIAEFYVSSSSLATLRFLFILLVGFYGFFSY